MEAGQLLVLFGILDGLGRVGVVPALPLVLVLGEVVEQRAELLAELFRQQRHVFPALVRQPGERLGTLGRLQRHVAFDEELQLVLAHLPVNVVLVHNFTKLYMHFYSL